MPTHGLGALDPLTRTSRQCVACQSRYRKEIDEMLRMNERSLVEISEWLKKQEGGEEIHPNSLGKHREHCFVAKDPETGMERHLETLTEFLDLVIDKVKVKVESGELTPTVTEAVKAADIKGRLKESSKWEKELVKFFLDVSKKHGYSN